MESKRRGVILRGGAVCLGLMLGLAAAEFGLRVYLKTPSSPVPINAIRSDPVAHMSWVANYDGWHRVGPLLTRFRTNSFGLRDDETTLKKPDGVYRILVVGDSYTQGQGVEQHEIFSHVVEEEMVSPEGFKRTEIIQCGVSAWGPDEEIAWIEDRGLAFEPDLVILAFYTGNDYLDASMPNPYWIHRGMRLMVWDEARMNPLWEIRIWLRKNVFLWGFTLDAIRSFRKAGPYRGAEDVGMLGQAIRREPESAMENIEPLFERLAELASESGTDAAILVLPWYLEVDDEYAEYVGRIQEIEVSTVDLDIFGRVAIEAAEKAGLEVFDARPALRAACEEGQRIHIGVDPHYNATGHRVVGEWLAKELQQRHQKVEP